MPSMPRNVNTLITVVNRGTNVGRESNKESIY